jgi:hypothetical protein
MAFCTNCGKQIDEGRNFCSGCGQKLTKQEPALVKEEQRARLVLSTNRKEGFLKSIPCYLVFFNDEVVMAHLGRQRQKSEIEAFRKEMKEQGKGFLKSTLAMINFWRDYGQKYYVTHRSAIMEEEPGNISIPYSDMARFLFKAVSRNVGNVGTDTTTNTGSSSYGKIIIKTASTKYKFTHNYYDSNKKIKQILSDLLGKTLKYKGNFMSLTITIGGSKDGIN